MKIRVSMPSPAQTWFALVLAVLSFVLSPSRALAQCAPNPAVTGATVSCSGAVPGGFDGGAANSLGLTVQPGGVIGLTTNNGATGLNLNNDNIVINRGAVQEGDDSTGIMVGGGNTVTNAAGASIRVGNASTSEVSGIFGIGGNGAANTITNLGSITAGIGPGGTAFGIVTANTGDSVVNGVGGTITVGAGSAAGIEIDGFRSSVLNQGTITSGDITTGIFADANRANVVNAAGGTITTGTYSSAIVATNANSTVQNFGVVMTGVGSFGINVEGINANVTNSVRSPRATAGPAIPAASLRKGPTAPS